MDRRPVSRPPGDCGLPGYKVLLNNIPLFAMNWLQLDHVVLYRRIALLAMTGPVFMPGNLSNKRECSFVETYNTVGRFVHAVTRGMFPVC